MNRYLYFNTAFYQILIQEILKFGLHEIRIQISLNTFYTGQKITNYLEDLLMPIVKIASVYLIKPIWGFFFFKRNCKIGPNSTRKGKTIFLK